MIKSTIPLLTLSLVAGVSHASEISATLAPLPEKVTSFGAVTHDGWLYVFGGHKGERHDYNVEMVSGSFQRLKLSDGGRWESLPSAPAAQGVPLVAHGHYIYRIGGMAARNQPDQKQDLFSMNIVQRFDVRSGRWSEFTPLPAPRSSHDAVVVGNSLYVGGGWQLAGGTNKPVWPDQGWVIDLAVPDAKWRQFSQPFKRRALALAAMDGRIFCIGGMDSNNEPTLAVEIYDPVTRSWSAGPELPPGKHKGFSCSAITQNGRLYASSFQGDVLRLAKDAVSWEVVGRLQHPRLSHRLVTAGSHQLIALGGEDGEDKRPDLELLTPSLASRTAERAAAATTTANP